MSPKWKFVSTECALCMPREHQCIWIAQKTMNLWTYVLERLLNLDIICSEIPFWVTLTFMGSRLKDFHFEISHLISKTTSPNMRILDINDETLEMKSPSISISKWNFRLLNNYLYPSVGKTCSIHDPDSALHYFILIYLSSLLTKRFE